MSFRSIVVHVDSDDSCNERLQIASTLAHAHRARLFAVFIARPPAIPMTDVTGYAATDIVQLQVEAEKERAQAVRATVESKLRKEGAIGEWRSFQDGFARGLARAGALADLIVMSQGTDNSKVANVATVALTAGCPVLVLPERFRPTSVGKRVLLAWNGTREASRAMHDALPFLLGADHVTLFAADEAEAGVGSANDAAARLAAHGVRAEVQRTTLGSLDAGNAILNAASDTSSDLVVMGAYGHSRLHEWAFGGATRTILQSMTVPVLLSH